NQQVFQGTPRSTQAYKLNLEEAWKSLQDYLKPDLRSLGVLKPSLQARLGYEKTTVGNSMGHLDCTIAIDGSWHKDTGQYDIGWTATFTNTDEMKVGGSFGITDSALMVEAITCVSALKWALSHSCMNVLVYTDSEVLVALLQRPTNTNVTLHWTLQEIRQLGSHFQLSLAKAQAPATSPTIASPAPPLPTSNPPTTATPLAASTSPVSSPTAPPPQSSPPPTAPPISPSVQTPSLPPAPVTQPPPPVQPPAQPPAPVSPPPATSPAPATVPPAPTPTKPAPAPAPTKPAPAPAPTKPAPAPAPTKPAPAPAPVAISPSLAPVNSPSTAPAPAPSEGKKKRKHKHHHAPAPAPIPPSPPAPPTAVTDTSEDMSPAPSPDLNAGISIYQQGYTRSKWMTGLIAAALLVIL
uniref:RNase H type-1 domain-containing protein n=1 Tax=Chenopodium quinoa TaxID=63459 RepID=A0A803L7B7_CHEQI